MNKLAALSSYERDSMSAMFSTFMLLPVKPMNVFGTILDFVE